MLTLKKTTCLLFFCCLTLVASPVRAASPVVEEILVKSGAIEQLAQISRVAQLSYEKAAEERDANETRQSSAMRERIQKLIGEAFAPDRLKESIGADLEAKLTPADMQAIIKWLDSPLVKRCTQLEIEASSPEASDEIDAYTADLNRNPAPKGRSQLAKQFDAAQQATRSTVTVILGMQIASLSAVVAMLPTEKQVSFSELVKVAEKQRPALESSMRPMVRAQILYTYRSLSTADFKRYITEMGSGPGKKFYSVCQRAYEKALIEASARSSRSILESVRNMEKETDA